ISVISAPDREPSNKRPAPPDLNCRYLCNCYFSVASDGTVSRTSSIYHSPQKNGPVRFEMSANRIGMQFDLQHFEKEWEFVRQALS
ncbi:MAG: hypothetical protein ACREPG_02965, partial [Candidatus Binatia bacterium]